MDKRYLILSVLLAGVAYYLYQSSTSSTDSDTKKQSAIAQKVKKMTAQERRAYLRT